jgi:hypothetical protein
MRLHRIQWRQLKEKSAIHLQPLSRERQWRFNSRLTLNYGLRYEVNAPVTEIRNRLNAFVPGQRF